MSAPSESATSPSPCACTNISLMQLFHELKQKFPGVPDHVVSNTIELYCHDKQACETHLHSEVKASLTHAYHASSSAAARQLNELKITAPGKCRNQPIVKHEAPKSTAVKSITCQGPQTAIISTGINENGKEPNTDANQNVVEHKNKENRNINTSPITVINIDNCYAKNNAESPSDLELTNDNTKEEKFGDLPKRINLEHQGGTNYRINKSNKIKSNLPERLEKAKEKKTIKKEKEELSIKKEESSIKKEEPSENKEELNLKKEKPNIRKEEPSINKEEPSIKKDEPSINKEEPRVKKQEPSIKKEEKDQPVQPEKPERPKTLDFRKPNPDIAFKPTLKETEGEPCRTVSPIPPQKHETPSKEKSGPFRPERGYPLNLSVNVNCHMDYSRGYGDPWLEEYDSPRAITSVNLTVCTPTSNMASPVRDTREEDSGFEGHVTVTVSPSTARPPRRPAPPPPNRPSRLESPRPTRVAPEPPGSAHDRSLIERQKERLGRLAMALAQEKGRLAQLNRETQILAAPPPPPAAAQRLKEYVEKLRDQCDTLAKRLEMGGNEQDDSGNFYSNIYTGQRPPSSWQCHICTFRNHPLLDKCEQCEMPRIFVGTSPARTHDSGFGSFRDRNRKVSSEQQTDIADSTCVNIVEDIRALPKLET